MAHIPPETRFWRTDDGHGRNIHALLTNDPTKPSDDDPLIGSMASPTAAEDVVNTHNGALAMYGRRYPQMLSDAEVAKGVVDDEVYFKASSSEQGELLKLTTWLMNGPLRVSPIVEKLHHVLGGEADE